MFRTIVICNQKILFFYKKNIFEIRIRKCKVKSKKLENDKNLTK
jgi:hypothetical protein